MEEDFITTLQDKYKAQQRFRNLVDGFVVYMLERNVMANDIMEAIDDTEKADAELVKAMAAIKGVTNKEKKEAVYVAFDDISKHGTTLQKTIDDMNKAFLHMIQNE